jgi:ribonuclease R
MKKKIISLFKNTPGLNIKAKELAQKLQIYGEQEYLSLKSMLYDLVEENVLIRKGKRYKYNSGSDGKLIGTLKITEGGYGFVTLNKSGRGDIFIAARNLSTAFNGDIVEVSLFAKQKGKNLEGEVSNIVKRSREEIIGDLHKTKSFYFVKADESDIHRDIYIPEKDLNGAKNGDKVVINKIDWNTPNLNPEGKVKEVLGKSGLYNTEIFALAREFNLPFIFPKSVIREVDHTQPEISEKDIQKRLDLRSKNIFTIDPEDAKDFDDAVSVEKLENNNYLVGIHIADVSHFVKEETATDSEALKRGNSVYFVGKVIPMLPEKLSNNICSLVPGQDRLTFSVLAEINKSGKLFDYKIVKSVINSKKRFTYDEAQETIDKKSGDFFEDLILLNDLAKIFRNKRMSKGSINFISPEVKFTLDESGFPVRIDKKITKESNMLIEEYMLLANQVVAKHIHSIKSKEELLFVYRVHDLPDNEKIFEFARFVKSLGYSFEPSSANKTKQFQKLLDEVKGREEEDVINEVAIRTMAKAVYSTDNIGHYGLGFKYYSHFTSPIRRYSDLVTHRLLNSYLTTGIQNFYKIDDLEEICEHISSTERIAMDAERTSVKLKQVEYLSNHLGEEFHGVVSGVTNFGMFVELTQNLAEGLVKLSDLEDDFYVYDDKNYSLIGRRTKKRFRLGDKINVKLIRVNKEKREVDFQITENEF